MLPHPIPPWQHSGMLARRRWTQRVNVSPSNAAATGKHSSQRWIINRKRFPAAVNRGGCKCFPVGRANNDMLPRCRFGTDKETISHLTDEATSPMGPTGKHSGMLPRRPGRDVETFRSSGIQCAQCFPVAVKHIVPKCFPVGLVCVHRRKHVSPSAERAAIPMTWKHS